MKRRLQTIPSSDERRDSLMNSDLKTAIADHDIKSLPYGMSAHGHNLSIRIRESELPVRILGHTSCEQEHVEGIFRYTAGAFQADFGHHRLGPKWDHIRRIFKYNYGYFSDLRRIQRATPIERLIVTNAGIDNYFGSCLATALNRRLCCILYFQSPPSQAYAALRPILSAVRKRLFLAAESMYMAKEIERITGEQCAAIPWPIISRKSPYYAMRRGILDTTRPLVGVFVGNPREEKGFQVLLEALKAFLQAPPRRNVRIRVQVDTKAANQAIRKASCELVNLASSTPLLETVHSPLTEDAYTRLLEAADFLICPHRAESYNKRSSGTIIEAAVYGKPVCINGSLILSQEFERYGCSVCFTEDDCAGLCSALAELVQNYEALLVGAQRLQTEMSRKHSIEEFFSSCEALFRNGQIEGLT